MGAIYALERIAKDSPKDHWTIMEVLTSLVREKSQTRHIPNIKITIDIQSALAVIGRRDSSKDSEYGRLDLSNTNLQQANLSNLYCQGFCNDWRPITPSCTKSSHWVFWCWGNKFIFSKHITLLYLTWYILHSSAWACSIVNILL